MAIELKMLALAGLLTLGLSLLTIVAYFFRFGGAALRDNREGDGPLPGLVGRTVRTHHNLIEALVPFAAVVVAAQLAGISNPVTVEASAIFLAARIAHAALYLAGVRVLRSAAFYVGVGSTIAIAIQLPLAP
ncbi:MAPEG family protein [Sphingomonas sp. SFZ2018-12]|nr:MAPEG family protein [Sphingomonas sp. SFZ2018-12]